MKAFKWFGIILVVLTMVLSACGGAPAAAPTAVPPAAAPTAVPAAAEPTAVPPTGQAPDRSAADRGPTDRRAGT